MALHLRGMWVAFGVAAAFIVHFLLRVRRALALRDAELEASRNLAARQDRLASLATLAAGAAHELATPLSTIAVVAKELERQIARAGLDPADAAPHARGGRTLPPDPVAHADRGGRSLRRAVRRRFRSAT